MKTILYSAPTHRDRERARAEKSQATSAAQKAGNDKRARARLEMLLAENFTGRDLFLTLTYRDAALPSRRKGAIILMSYFLLDLRRHRAAQGQELKYVCTTDGTSGEARLHHHLVINATGQDVETIRGLWPFGDVVNAKEINKIDYASLAAYITKESPEGRPAGAHMWNRSRNLKRPVAAGNGDIRMNYPPGDKEIYR